MPTDVQALITTGANKPFERGTITRRDPRAHDVVIDIAYAGICHSDIHQAREEWGQALFPMVPGHEIAGTVSAVGAEVTSYAVGDRVGVGCFVDSCRECENCLAGEEQYCLKGEVATYNGKEYDGEPTFGGYSRSIVVDENYVLGIPEGVGLDVAAPLLCAGITLYSPLKHWGAGPGKRVAIVGMGGLGHMGVKIAHALGAEVTVLSQTLSKQEDGARLGADHYYATSDKQTFKDLRGTFDLIINTVAANLPSTATSRCCVSTGRWSTSASPTAPTPSTPSRSPACGAAWPARRSAASARPRRCSTSAPSTGWAPRSRRSASTTSTPPTSGSWPATCATGS